MPARVGKGQRSGRAAEQGGPRRLSSTALWKNLMFLVSAASCADGRFARKQQGDGGERQNHADNGKGIAEPHDQRLTLDETAQRDDRLVLSGGRVGYAMRQKAIRHLANIVLPYQGKIYMVPDKALGNGKMTYDIVKSAASSASK
jgi:hypothetical protein